MIHPCRWCEEPSTRRCSGCKTPTAWYCSTKCQRAHWAQHIFECNPKKPINTAYHLADAAIRDTFPTDLQTCQDYGFDRAFTPENKSKLLGLYIGLMHILKVKPKTIHQWRLEGTLIEEIKLAFEGLPEHNRGGYYPWFLQNEWVLDPKLRPPTDPAHEMVLRGWRYAGGSSSATQEEIRVATTKWPEYKQHCSAFCTALLSRWHPCPEQAIWLTFGFCVCRDEYSESSLAQLYRELLSKCSFDEIYSAYESSTLIALFDAKGLRDERQSILHLEDVLGGSPKWNKSVWDLKQYVMATEGDLIPSVTADYGFFNCKGEAERLQLKEAYKQLFACYHGDPIKLHEAAIGGRIFEYVGGLVKLKKKFSRLMKNPYPLPDV